VIARRGGAYVFVLALAAVVAVLAVGGLMVRGRALEVSSLRADGGAARLLARSAVELGLQAVEDGAEPMGLSVGTDFARETLGEGLVRAYKSGDVGDGVVTVRGESAVGGGRALLDVDVAVARGYRDRVLLLGPELHWPLDEASGEESGGATELMDGRDGVYQDWSGVAALETGPDGGGAPRFDDSNDMVVVSHHGKMNAKAATVVFWLYSTSDSSAPRYAVSKDATGYGKGGEWSVFLWWGRVYATLESKSSWRMLPGPVVARDTWTHVAMSCGDEGFTLYVNGVDVARDGSWTIGPNGGGNNNKEPFVFGGTYALSSGLSAELFGSVREVSYFDRQLSKEEIAGLYNGGDWWTPMSPVVQAGTWRWAVD
jgi:hypothetical protein